MSTKIYASQEWVEEKLATIVDMWSYLKNCDLDATAPMSMEQDVLLKVS